MSINSDDHESDSELPTQYAFSSPKGHQLARRILRPPLPYNPHDGLKALAINVDTLAAARSQSKNLWKIAWKDVSTLCLSPEQLISEGYAGLLECATFWKRLVVLGVDKIHLLYQWEGKTVSLFSR